MEAKEGLDLYVKNSMIYCLSILMSVTLEAKEVCIYIEQFLIKFALGHFLLDG